MADRNEDRERDAKHALDRATRDAESLGGARAGQRLRGHFSGADAPAEADGAPDWAEVWGRRVGRALSLVGVVVLAYLLGVQLKLW